MWLDKLIIDNRETLNKTDIDLLKELQKIGPKLSDYSILELSKKVHTSKSSLSRLAQKVGFTGYAEFKYFCKEQKETVKETDTQEPKEKIKRDIENTIKLAESTNFEQLTSYVKNARIIYCYGTGHAQRKALEEFARLLITIDKRVIVIPVITELMMTVSMMNQEDILVICSLSGNTAELKAEVAKIKSKNIPLIGISRFSENYLGDISDLSYYYYCSEFIDPKKERKRLTLVTLNILLDWIYRECFTNYLTQ